jgi:hypothetical protein
MNHFGNHRPATYARRLVGGQLRVVGAALLAALQLVGCANMIGTAQVIPSSGLSMNSAEETFGIRVEGLRLSAAGSMLDFRYRVLDAQKAAPMLDGRIQPYLLDETHGAKLGVPDTPVLGRIRQTARNGKIFTDRTYFIMFGNPGKVLQSGDKVTLLLGAVKVTDVAVR